MKALLLLTALCFTILWAGCDTNPGGKVLSPVPVLQERADGDGTVVKAKRIPVPGPLLPGQVRPTYAGDPDASQKGDPTSDD